VYGIEPAPSKFSINVAFAAVLTRHTTATHAAKDDSEIQDAFLMSQPLNRNVQVDASDDNHHEIGSGHDAGSVGSDHEQTKTPV
jgi:hypothetical protein